MNLKAVTGNLQALHNLQGTSKEKKRLWKRSIFEISQEQHNNVQVEREGLQKLSDALMIPITIYAKGTVKELSGPGFKFWQLQIFWLSYLYSIRPVKEKKNNVNLLTKDLKPKNKVLYKKNRLKEFSQ